MVFGSGDISVKGAGPSTGDVAFTPLAMPSLSGPGSISVVLTMSSEVPTNMLVNGHVVVIIGIAITCAIAWVVLRLSTVLITIIGRAGMDVLTRIFGFLLVAIAMQFLLGGIADFYSTRFPTLFQTGRPS
jgi:multiple antibiotic resistance protein